MADSTQRWIGTSVPRKEDPALLSDGHPDYEKIRASEDFAASLERVVHGHEQGFSLCLVCAEKNPTDCHRARLIGPALVARGVPYRHLLHDGRLVPHEELAAASQGSLF